MSKCIVYCYVVSKCIVYCYGVSKCIFYCYGVLLWSTVDYVIVNDECYDLIDYMNVHSITTFSDLCPVEFIFCYNIDDFIVESQEFDKVTWNSNEKESFINTLKENEDHFRELTTKLISGENGIKQCMSPFF